MSPNVPTVATLVEPSYRTLIENAGGDRFRARHLGSVRDVIRVVRERPVHAVLMSPRRVWGGQLDDVERLIREFPGIPTVAVVTRDDFMSGERLLHLGAHGVRLLVDLSDRAGLRRLREMIRFDVDTTSARFLNTILPALQGATRSTRHFFEIVVSLAPRTSTVRGLADYVQVPPSTFMSRFFRVGVPSPKSYLTGARLVHAAALLETPGLSISDVAHRLEYSSPQAFGRHVRAVTGLTAGEFRRRFAFEPASRDFVARLILPFQATFETFHPL